MTLRILEDLAQGTEEWLAQRRGMVTASVVGRLIAVDSPDATTVACPTCNAEAGGTCLSMAKRKDKDPSPIKTIHEARSSAASDQPPTYSVANNDTSRALTATLVAERISGLTEDIPINSDMWRGITSEPYARDLYAEHHAPVTEVGFMVEDKWGFRIGYSPDGLVGEDGLIEIKAPRTKAHLLAVINDQVPAHNMAQLQAGLLVSGRSWVDFIPYVGGMAFWKKRIAPDPAWHAAIVAAVAAFEKTAADMTAAYAAATEGLPVTELIDPYAVELKL